MSLSLSAPAHAAKPYVLEANGSLPANLAAQVQAAGGTLIRVQPEIGLAEATSNNPSFAANLAAGGSFLSVTPDMIVQWTPPLSSVSRAASLPSSAAAGPSPSSAFFFGCQWNLQQIDAPGAWAQGQFGSPAIKVAVLDTGTDPTHIDLVGRIDTAHSVSVLTPGSSPCGPIDETTFLDFFFHGTFVSSLITSNSLGIAAVAPNTQVVGVKVLSCVGSGSFGDVIAGIHYAAGLPDVGVINMSLGALIPKHGNEALLHAINKAVDFAVHSGKLVVSAAGNSAIDLRRDNGLVEVPAEAGSDQAVYALGITQTLASYSNFGDPLFLGAPGGDFPDPLPPLAGCPIPAFLQSFMIGACSSFVCGAPNFYLVGAGTSFASPTVAGVAALVDGANGAALDANRLEAILAQTATALGNPQVFTRGEVDASRAVGNH